MLPSSFLAVGRSPDVRQTPLPVSSVRGTNRLQFAGGTRLLAKDVLSEHSIRIITESLPAHQQFHFGSLPKVLIDTKLPPNMIYERFDQLATMLRSINNWHEMPKFEGAFGNTPFSCETVGIGFGGMVYRINIKDQSFAFKVFYSPECRAYRDAHGPRVELNRHLSLRNYRVNDLTRFLCGHRDTWHLMEFDEGKLNFSKRRGRPLQEVMSREDFTGGDFHISNRGPSGGWIDIGGIEKGWKNIFKLKEKPVAITPEEFAAWIGGQKLGTVSTTALMSKLAALTVQECSIAAPEARKKSSLRKAS